MNGYLSDAVANALKNWDPLKSVHMVPIRATDGTTVIENCPIPAIAIHLMGTDDNEAEGGTAFGGGIRFYFDLILYCLLPVTNYTFSPDFGKQAQMLDMSEDVVRCIEQTTLLDEVKKEHDLNLQFSSMTTDTTYGTRGAESVVVDVHKVIYKGSVKFDPKDPSKTFALLENIKIEYKI